MGNAQGRKLFMVAGQSNTSGVGDAPQSPIVPPGIAFEYDAIHDTLVPLADPVGYFGDGFTPALTGSSWPAFAIDYHNRTGDTVIVIQCAKPGSAVHPLADAYGSWDSTATLFDLAVTKAEAAMAKTGLPLSGIIWGQGGREARVINEQGTITPNDYKVATQDLFSRFRGEFGCDLNIYILKTVAGSDCFPDSAYFAIRDMQQEVANEDPRTFIVLNNNVNFRDLGWLKDCLHYNQTALNYVGEVSARAIDSIEQTLPPPLAIMLADKQDITCPGGDDGSIILSAMGGIPAYQYSIDDGNSYGSDSAFTNLMADEYTLLVRDSSGCAKEFEVELTQPDAFDITVNSQNNPACAGDLTGSFAVDVTGSVPPYTYSIDGSIYVGIASFGNLGAGDYTFYIKDSINCLDSTIINITEPNPLTVSIDDVLEIDCAGNNNGGFTIDATGGVQPYAYSLDGSNFTNDSVFSSLMSGNYTLYVRDTNNCEATLDTSLVEPAPLGGIIANQDNVLCAGDSTGSIEIMASGGTAPYLYTIDSLTFLINGVFNDLAADSYSMTIIDGNNCVDIFDFTITEPAPLVASIVYENDALCTGDPSGNFKGAASGGIAPYTFSIDGNTFTAVDSFLNLLAGSYTLSVQDSNSCTASTTATIDEPTPVVLTLDSTMDVLCSGDNTGSLSVTASGGTPSYMYTLDNGNTVTTSIFTDLIAGSYLLTAIDDHNCEDTLTVSIAEPPTLTISIDSVKGANCGGNGTVYLSATGGDNSYTYSLANGSFGPDSIFDNLIGGNYTANVMDGNGCVTSTLAIVPDSSGLRGVLTSQTNVSCNGGSDGAFTLIGFGGTAPYFYSLDGGPFVPTNSFSGLDSGYYNVLLLDASGCIAIREVTITEPTLPQASVAGLTNVGCLGDSTGSVTFSSFGGTAPYEYALDGVSFQSTETFNGLASGNYTITVRDANNCTNTTAFTITEPTALGLSLADVTDANCHGESSGSLTLAGFGGTAPYQYSIDSLTFTSASTFDNLPAAPYNVYVQDAQGCIADNFAIIGEPPALNNALANLVNVDCFGNNTGSITLQASGGMPSYVYSIDSVNYIANNVFNNLSAGVYTTSAQDAHGCIATLDVTVSEPDEIVGSVTSLMDVSCFGTNDGGFSVTASGGVSPYQYSIDGVNFFSTGTFLNLTAGDYTVTITDATNCTGSVDITLTEPTQITANIIALDDVDCLDNATGSISIEGQGGIAPYTYSIDGFNYLATGNFTNLLAGTYTLNIQDDNGCIVDTNIVVNEPDSLVASILTQNEVSCNGTASGSLEIGVIGGTAPYQYSPDGVVFDSDALVDSLFAGNQLITVRDTNGCITTVGATLSEPPILTASIVSQTDADCNGSNTGSATIQGAGGTPGYAYSIDSVTFLAGGVLTDLFAGTYDVYVQDLNACVTSIPLTINEPIAIDILVSSQTDILCAGDSTGSFSVAASGGLLPYEYSLDGTTYSSSDSFSDLTAGNYTTYVRDDNGCVNTLVVTLTEPAPLAGNIVSQTDAICEGSATGSVTVEGVGGESPYEYSIDGINYAVGNTFVNLGAGTYTILIRDANTCISPISVTIGEPIGLMGVEISAEANCAGDSSGTLVLGAMGGTPPYFYSLDGINFSNSNTFTNLPGGTYTVTIRDTNDCETTLFTSITEPAPVTLTITGQTDATCFGSSTGAITVMAFGGTPGYAYAIDSSNFFASNTFNNLAAGDYLFEALDSKGCIGSLTATILEPDSLTSTIVSQVNVDCNGNNSGSFTIDGVGGTPPYQYSIDGITFSNSGTFASLGAGLYTVAVLDANLCTHLRTVVITEPDVLDATIVSQTNIDCPGNIVGQVTIEGVGGTAPYEYSIDATNFSFSGTFANLFANTYTITVRDVNGCIINVPVTITEPPILTASIDSLVPVDCNGNATGSITIQGNGGTPAYQYSLDAINFQGSGEFTGLVAGNYTITVQDSNACVTSIVATLTEPTALIAAIDSLEPSDCDTPGAMYASASGGTLPYTYSLDNLTYSSSGDYPSLNAGAYTLYVEDGNACMDSLAFSITDPSGLSLSLVSKTEVSCNGGGNGDLEVIGNGGLPPYQYSINGIVYSSNPSFSNLNAGSYTVNVRDANLCLASLLVIITEPDPVEPFSISVVPPICEGDTNGSLIIGAMGGTAPYIYSIDGLFYNPDSLFTDLGSGTYTMYSIDANSCMGSTDVTINDNPLPNPTIIGDTTYCSNDSAVLNAGIGFASYLWSTGDTTQAIAATNTSNPISVMVTDTNGCVGNSMVITLEEKTSPSPSIYGDATFCDDIGAMLSTDPGYIYYSWSTGDTTQSIVTFIDNVPVTVTVIDTNNCQAISPPIVPKSKSPFIPQILGDLFHCPGDSTQLSADSIFTTYLWSTGDTSQFAFASRSDSLIWLTATSPNGCVATSDTIVLEEKIAPDAIISGDLVYCVEGVAVLEAPSGFIYEWSTGSISQQVSVRESDNPVELVMTDGFGCSDTASVNVVSGTFLQVDAGPDTLYSCSGGAIMLGGAPTASGGEGPYTYTWFPSVGLNDPFASNPTAMTMGNPREYFLAVTDQCGFTVFDTVFVAIGFDVSITATPQNGPVPGSTDLTVTGGVPPFTYLWSTGDTTEDVAVIDSGWHYVDVQDANGCTISDSVFVPAIIDCTRDVFENNNTVGQSAILPEIGVVNNAQICPSGDQDWFRINIPLNQVNVRLTLFGLDPDYKLEFYSSDIFVIAEGNPVNDSTPLVVIVNNLTPGLYFVRIYSETGAFQPYGNYSLYKQIRATPFSTNVRDEFDKEPIETEEEVQTNVKESLEEAEALAAEAFQVNVYPNPTQGSLHIAVALEEKAELSIRVTDIAGKLIQRQTVEGEAGEQTIDLDLNNVSSGVYFVEVVHKGERIVEKVIKE